MEIHLNDTLKEFQSTLLREVATMISTQLKNQMDKINVSIDKVVSNALNAGMNQHYITPTDNSSPLTPENQLITNQITPQKPLGTIRVQNYGNSLLTAQQKLDNLQI